ncbi:vitamin K epoxide reductase family protein [Tenacibaculum xiamenense]|uniref:vitamin K epoxide reductase family protein n=1 Tax=Tenacibaculum xiamenense TaxID=1261553 RepID=UPI003894D8F0
MKDSLGFLTRKLLELNEISIDFKELEFQIQSHPSYPSLYSITGVLDHFNIKNLALEVPSNQDVLNQLPNAFIAHVKKEDHKLFVLVKKLKHSIKIIYDSNNNENISNERFLDLFTGIIITIESQEAGKIVKLSSKKYKTNLLAIIAIIVLGSALIVTTKESTNNILFVVLSAIGVYLSYNIVLQEQGTPALLGNTLCNNDDKYKNCNAVLASKGSRITKNLKLSDLSVIFYLGMLVTSFLLLIFGYSLSIPKLISFMALTVTIYSIYYQKFIVKQWCTLCLIIVSLIWVQACTALINFTFSISLKPILITALTFIVAQTLWISFSQFMKENNTLKSVKLEYYKFKRNFDLFNNQLQNSSPLDTVINSTQEIYFGNPNSQLNITIITNPLCGHCKGSHNLMNILLKHHEKDLCITLRFNVNLDYPESYDVKISAKLLELYNTNNKEECLHALNAIYGTTDPKEWLNKWGTITNKESSTEILKTQRNWCKTNGINFTPAILINGRSYPKNYKREELTHFIDDLIEYAKQNTYAPLTVAKKGY